MTIEFTPIGYVTEVLSHNAENKHTVNMRERIQILPEYREGLNGLECGNKIQLIFHFHLSKGYRIAVFAKGRDYETGIFNSRSPHRPNGIGVTEVTIVSISIDEGEIVVDGGDLFAETPILDIKPAR